MFADKVDVISSFVSTTACREESSYSHEAVRRAWQLTGLMNRSTGQMDPDVMINLIRRKATTEHRDIFYSHFERLYDETDEQECVFQSHFYIISYNRSLCRMSLSHL